jgi:hypothetical protein
MSKIDKNMPLNPVISATLAELFLDVIKKTSSLGYFRHISPFRRAGGAKAPYSLRRIYSHKESVYDT